MTQTLITADLAPIDLGNVDIHAIPRRSYDFNKGDRRFFDHEEALEHARNEAILTGVRQTVRLDGPAIHGHESLHLVQAVGS